MTKLVLLQALRESRDRSTKKLVDMEEEDDFDDPVSPSPVKGGCLPFLFFMFSLISRDHIVVIFSLLFISL